MSIAENVARVRERIREACERAGRDPGEVTLVGVTKAAGLPEVRELVAAGVTNLGENRVQEALEKFPALAGVRRHLIGHLQRNKAAQALETFDLIHSVDSLRIAERLSFKAVRPMPVLLEVNAGLGEDRYGFLPEELDDAVGRIRGLSNIEVTGLMAMAPFGAGESDCRRVFGRVRELARGLGLPALSMGMSADYPWAIAEGATLVRIGSALFGRER